jgi:hypothetical protein
VELLAKKLEGGISITSAQLIKDAKQAWEDQQANLIVNDVDLQLNEAIRDATNGDFNPKTLSYGLRAAADQWIGRKKLYEAKSSKYGIEWKMAFSKQG